MIPPRLYVTDDFTPFAELIMQYGSRIRIEKNTVLRDANGADRAAYFIRDGVAKLSFVNEEGTEGTLLFFGKGAIYPINGVDEVLTAENYLQLVSVTDMDVIRFPARRVLDLCRTSTEFNVAIINHYVRYVNVLITKLLLNSYNDSTQLVSALLYLYVHERGGENTIIDLTQEQIGQITGLSRTQVTRVLSTLRNNSVIRTLRGRLQVIDPEKLRHDYTRMSDLI